MAIQEVGPTREAGSPRSHPFTTLVEEAARVLKGQGWHIEWTGTDEDAPWHVLAAKGEKLRVVQVVPPVTAPAVRQARRLALGEAARLSSQMGLMEQWLAHVRPDGRITFGPYLLNAQHWGLDDPSRLQKLLGVSRTAA